MASDNNVCNNGSTEKELQELWSTSFDAWIDVPRHPPGVVYFRPSANEIEQMNTPPVDMPSIVRECHGGIFALTAYNPLGQDAPTSENLAANALLAADLAQLQQKFASTSDKDDAPTVHVWNSFGFAPDWRENGFVVAFEAALTAKDAERAVVDLARTYRQGAIYKYVPITSNGEDRSVVGLRRKTIPVAMQNVEADVIVVPCEKPDLANAEVVV